MTPELVLVGSYDYRVVALSVVIAVLGSYVALDLGERVTAARGRVQLWWLIGGATAMGIGIWSMHYTAMPAFHLRPSLIDDLGLVAALRWYVDREGQRAGITAAVVTDELDARLQPALETACFRIAQEALTNVVRHAQAHQVWVELR
jgi:hypothetical protein